MACGKKKVEELYKISFKYSIYNLLGLCWKPSLCLCLSPSPLAVYVCVCVRVCAPKVKWGPCVYQGSTLSLSYLSSPKSILFKVQQLKLVILLIQSLQYLKLVLLLQLLNWSYFLLCLLLKWCRPKPTKSTCSRMSTFTDLHPLPNISSKETPGLIEKMILFKFKGHKSCFCFLPR